MADGWTFEWLTRWDEVWDPAFVSQWKGWMAESPTAHVFFEPSVVRAWYETYRDLRRIEPRFAIARDGSERLVLFPLVYDRGGWKDAWLRTILPPGHCEFDYHDGITVSCAQEAWSLHSGARARLAAATLVHWAKSFDLVSLGRTHTAEGPGAVDVVPSIDLQGETSLEDWLAGGRRKRLRQDLSRKVRALDAVGGLEMRIFGISELSDARAELADLCREHHRRWPGSRTPHTFYTHLLEAGLPRGIVHLSTLRNGARSVSWKIAFIFRRKLSMYVQAMSEDWEAYYPGIVHTSRLVDWALRNGVESIDLGMGNEVWKRHWTSTSSNLYEAVHVAQTVKSRIAMCWRHSIKPVLAKVKRTLLHH